MMAFVVGVGLILIGGFASGSFYIPYRKVKKWNWEIYWITGGLFSWIFMPWLAALLTVPSLFSLFGSAGFSDLFYPFLFGLLWGVGGLTFGLALRYLGISLGMAIALGLTAAFGTLIPPIFTGDFSSLLTTKSGIITLTGIFVALVGIGITGKAGSMKEKELSKEQIQENIEEFDFKKGLLVAFIAGLLSAGFAFGIAAGKPLANMATSQGTHPLFMNNPTFVIILIGGFLVNGFWCFYLAKKNKTTKSFFDAKTPLFNNYMFSAMAGTIWYIQFLFYGMGESKMGKYGFAAWSILMSSSIIFSNLWGIFLKEWKGTSTKTKLTLVSGLFILILSTVLIGYGSYLQQFD